MQLVVTISTVILGLLVATFLLTVVRGAPFIPSHKKQVRRAFEELYPLSANDVVVDLGSGSGTVLAVAREFGAKAIGYEINPFLWFESRVRVGQDDRIDIRLADYNVLPKLPVGVSVVYAFTTSQSINTIGRKLEEWSAHQDLVFISYGFTFADRAPDKTAGPMHLYKFPA